jgi:hypothetical protein
MPPMELQFCAAVERFGNVRSGSRVCENSDVQLACRTSISISSMWESIVLATSFRRRQLRKQFCASFAQARFHTAWVNRRLMHRSKQYLYSITSSATEISPAGITSPRALAVFILITSSNLVGCTTGKSAGLSPLRILPV